MDVHELPLGQLLARTRWDTHASGLAFDRKKTSLLTEQAQAFFHCPKYIKTRIPGLTGAVASPSEVVQRVVIQNGDWSAALAYERARTETSSLREEPVVVCRV